MEAKCQGISGCRLGFVSSSLKMLLGDEEGTVAATLSKADAAGRITLSWASSNEAVVKIKEEKKKAAADGKKAVAATTVSPEGIGTAWISVTAKDDATGMKSVAWCRVTVTNPVKMLQVTGDGLGKLGLNEEKVLELRKGQTDVLFLDVSPNATNINKITWKGSGGVAVKNGVVTARKATQGPVPVTVKCGNAVGKIYVKVTE